MKSALRTTLFALPMVFGLAGGALAGSASDMVDVNAPYVRAVPPGQPNSAAFMMLKNRDAQAHAVVNASSDVAKVVELHTHIHEGGMMKMRRIDKIDVPANGMAELKPGGLHVMLIGLKRELAPGQKVAVTLEYEDGSTETVEAPVRKVMMQMNMKKDMGGMKHNMK